MTQHHHQSLTGDEAMTAVRFADQVDNMLADNAQVSILNFIRSALSQSVDPIMPPEPLTVTVARVQGHEITKARLFMGEQRWSELEREWGE